MTLSRSIHVATNGILSFFLIAEQYSIVHMYHIFFIHSPVVGHLGHFQLWLLETVWQQTLGFIPFQTMYFSRYMPRNETAGSHGTYLFSFFFFFFNGTSILFSTVAMPIYIPTRSIEGFPSLHTFSRI